MQFAKVGGLYRLLCDHDDRLIGKTIFYTDPNNFSNALKPDSDNPPRVFIDPECTIEATAQHFEDTLTGDIIITMVSPAAMVWLYPIMSVPEPGAYSVSCVYYDVMNEKFAQASFLFGELTV